MPQPCRPCSHDNDGQHTTTTQRKQLVENKAVDFDPDVLGLHLSAWKRNFVH